MKIVLTQETSQTPIPPCSLRPLWFDFPLPVPKSWKIRNTPLQQIGIKRTTDKSTKTNAGVCFRIHFCGRFD